MRRGTACCSHVCACASAREGERGKEGGETEKGRERQSVCECVCVCLCEGVCNIKDEEQHVAVMCVLVHLRERGKEREGVCVCVCVYEVVCNIYLRMSCGLMFY